MKPVLLDTSCIVALLDRSEQTHQHCAEVVLSLRAPLITCEAVIAESCYLLRNVSGASDAVLANVEIGVFQIPFTLASQVQNARHLMKRFRNVPMDFADACLVCLAKELDTGQILTLDDDFQIYRWNKNKPFKMLLSKSSTT